MIDKTGRVIYLVPSAVDITKRKTAEDHIQHLQSVLKAIRTINQLIVHEKNPQKLLQRTCEILNQTRDYKMVWIGLVQEDTRDVLPVAQAGFEGGYLKSVKITWDDSETGKGPTGTAIKTKKPFVMRDLSGDPKYKPWREEATKRGYASSAAIPLVYEDKVFGALNVYATIPNSFDEEEMGLLAEVGRDIGFALYTIRMEEDTKRTKDFLQNIIDNTSDLVCTVDLEGNFLSINRAVTEQMGYKKEDLIGISKRELAVNQEQFDKVFRSLLEKGSVSNIEVQFKRKNGTIADILYSMTLLRDKDGQPIAIAGFGKDITKRKQTEERLRLLWSAVEQSTEGIAVTDLDDNLLFVNNAFATMHGYLSEELIGEHLSIFHTPEQIPAVEAANRQLQEAGKYSGEIWHVRRDGTVFPAMMHNFILRDETGNPIGIIRTLRDITDRKQAEANLLREKNFIDSVINSLPGIFYLFDENGRFLRWNENFVMASGYSAEEISKMNPLDFFVGEDKKLIKKGIQEVFAMGESKTEAKFVSKDGRRTPYFLTGLRFISDNQNYLVGMGIDITERKKAEEESIRIKNHLQNVIDSASEIIISIDKNNRVSTWNETAERITGYKKRAVLGRAITRLAVFDNPQEMVNSIKNIYLGRKVSADALVLRTKHGTKRIIKPSCSIIRDSNREPIGILLIGTDVTREIEHHGRLLHGNSYLIKETSNKSSIDLLVNLTKTDYKGLFITRDNPDMIKDLILAKNIQVELLNHELLEEDKLEDFGNISDLGELVTKIEEFSKKNANALILLDRIDYLITLFSFEQFVKSLYQINNIISKNKAILLVHIVPSLLNTVQMTVIESELKPLPYQEITDIELGDELYDILKFIYEQNQLNSLVSLSKISSEYSIDRATAAKRVRLLEDEGLVDAIKQGRRKTVHVTEKGRILLNKRQIA